MAIIEMVSPTGKPTFGPARGRVRVRTGPALSRPGTAGGAGGAGVRYPGAGVPMSRAPHRRRPVACNALGTRSASATPATPATPPSPAVTIAVALLAGLITLWLGLMAHFGGVAGHVSGGPAAVPVVPDRLGVVRIQAGESLAHLAARVAPGAPTDEVVGRIRELNRLDSAAPDAGQTLIVPIA